MPPSRLRGRMTTTTFVYDDESEHLNRPTGTIQSPEWTEDDRAALLGLAEYETTLCPGCGQPKHLAWHRRTDGEWEGHRWVCHACSAKHDQEMVMSIPVLEMPAHQRALMDAEPFDFEKTITEPSAKPETPRE